MAGASIYPTHWSVEFIYDDQFELIDNNIERGIVDWFYYFVLVERWIVDSVVYYHIGVANGLKHLTIKISIQNSIQNIHSFFISYWDTSYMAVAQLTHAEQRQEEAFANFEGTFLVKYLNKTLRSFRDPLSPEYRVFPRGLFIWIPWE